MTKPDTIIRRGPLVQWDNAALVFRVTAEGYEPFAVKTMAEVVGFLERWRALP